jgi:hypothetical protein
METGIGLNEVLIFIFGLFGMGFVALYQGRADQAAAYILLPLFLLLFLG